MSETKGHSFVQKISSKFYISQYRTSKEYDINRTMRS